MTTALPITTGAARADRLPVSAFLTDPLVIARRQLLRVRRTPQMAIATVTSPILFLALFRFVFGGAIPISGMSYIDYLVPAMLVQNIVFGGFTSAAGLALDASSGILDRFRSLPSPRSAVLAGRAIGDFALQVTAHILVIATGLALGLRFHTTLGRMLLLVVMLVAIGVGLFSVFAAMGLGVRNPETVQSMTPPFFLFLFVSSAFIPVGTLPGWLQSFAKYQPITVFTDTLRDLTQAAPTVHSTAWYVTTSLAWCAALTLLFAPLALRSYRRL
jgi:ABC-2 type transport system permease protein